MSVNEPLTPRGRYTVDLTDAEAQELRALVGAGTLRKKPPPRRRETEDYSSTLLRMIRALAKRAEGDVQQLAPIAEIAAAAEAMLAAHVQTCREQGIPWSEIGDGLAMTRQGAQQRFGRTARSSSTATTRGQVELPGFAE